MSEMTYDLNIGDEHYIVSQDDIDTIDSQLSRGERRITFTGRGRQMVWHVLSGVVYWSEHRPATVGRIR